ncbi:MULTISPECIES: aminodeoxychorismate synthase component I [unclassified Lentimicrobium]|uniref:aminodeoxychorismate synthase component I n=1 Tax=unclassified Lentimicrobium TaxID=2677434 RepID=UPI0015573F3B|nr:MULTISPECIES: aminodeoxychorismate synthase component I [unclassified Lentimicrobium]NPD46927.1 aminodeoxychorismate synthase component I [Lentimicrobium sp. S6]NPD84131.1 aminodeoxychorismate synthase component I [Lentimicrobium sp. L6]
MKLYSKEKAILQMNEWGRKRKPFLFVLSFDHRENILIAKEDLTSSGIHFQTPLKSFLFPKEIELPESIVFEKKCIAFSEFSESFNIAKSHLDFGNTYLINLTKPSKINTNLSFQQIFQHAQAPYKLWIKDKLVVFSPEIFVKIEDGEISSYPMKGTIDAAIPNAQQSILEDEKETAEHHTIVDLIRNDLSMVSKNVRVEKFRFLTEVKTSHKNLLQVSSEIRGDIDIDFFDQLGHHFFKLLPAGSICGAPKKKTLEVISEAENYDRGFYTGVFGYFDGKSLDSAVMIRYLEQQDEQVVFKSGGGITTFSQCKKEYEELKDKVYLPIINQYQ